MCILHNTSFNINTEPNANIDTDKTELVSKYTKENELNDHKCVLIKDASQTRDTFLL